MIFFHSETFSFLFLPNFFFFWRSTRKVLEYRSVRQMWQHACRIDVGWDGCTGRKTEVSVNELAAATTSKGADVMMWKVPVRRLDLLVNFDPPVVFILIENLFVCFFECYVHQDVAVDGHMMNKPRHVDGRCVRHQPIRPIKKRNDLRRLLLVRHWRITRLSHTNTHSLIPFAPLIQQHSRNHQPELKSALYQTLIKIDYLLGSKFGFHGNVTASFYEAGQWATAGH